MPALGLSLLLVAGGLILALAVGSSAGGVSFVAAGLVLAGVGAAGILISLLYMSGVFATEQAHIAEEHHEHVEHADHH